MDLQEIRVPDIGDFKDVPIVEIYVKAGDQIDIDAPLISIESDKATMDVPSPFAGVIRSIAVAIGDKVSKGSLLALVETRADDAMPPVHAQTASMRAPTPSDDIWDVAVIGGGPGGYSAAFRAADLGAEVLLIERDATLGGVCLNVGCIPSKALLHIAAVKEEAERLTDHGVAFGAPTIDLAKLRAFKSGVVERLTSGLSQMAKMRNVKILRGDAAFAGSHALDVSLADGKIERVAFRTCIIAAGSSSATLPFLPSDARIVDSTGALELPLAPRRMLIVGGGIIGLEMATVYSALGARLDIVEAADTILQGVDRDLVKIWTARNAHRFDRVLTATKLVSVSAQKKGLHAEFDGADAAPEIYDLILQATGRVPNGGALSLEATGLSHARGYLEVDAQMRTRVPHIFAVGDIVGQPMLAHKAVHQGHVAAEAALGLKTGFDAKVIPSVAYTDPEIAWVGLTETEAKQRGVEVSVARFPWSASGRAVANGTDYGMTKLIFGRDGGRVIGGAIVGASAGDLIGEVCLAIEMGADATDIGKTIHPHPTLGESVGMAAEVLHGLCTDLPPRRRDK